MHKPHRFTSLLHGIDATQRPTSKARRRSGAFAVCCVVIVAGCAGSRESEPPAATPALEPGVHDNDATKFTTVPGPTVTTDTPVPPPQAPATTTGSTTANAPAQSTAAADNTQRNVRDRDDHQPTPLDQGNSESDIKISATIREALMGEDALSFDAKNVKIITNGGRVVLRGPVKSAAEKTVIEAHAQRVAGSGHVTSQLEIGK